MLISDAVKISQIQSDGVIENLTLENIVVSTTTIPMVIESEDLSE